MQVLRFVTTDNIVTVTMVFVIEMVLICFIAIVVFRGMLP